MGGPWGTATPQHVPGTAANGVSGEVLVGVAVGVSCQRAQGPELITEQVIMCALCSRTKELSEDFREAPLAG